MVSEQRDEPMKSGSRGNGTVRKSGALVLLALCSWVAGFGQVARAGVTFDVLFQDGTGTQLTILPGDPGPGCEFGGSAGGSTATGHCMDVILRSTYESVWLGTSVSYDSDNGLAVGSMYEWKGIGVQFSGGVPTIWCVPLGGLADKAGGPRSRVIESFDCLIPPPTNPPTLPAGTYRVGTIVWDTSSTTPGTETIAAFINDLLDGVGAVINGNVVSLQSADIVQNSTVLRILSGTVPFGAQQVISTAAEVASSVFAADVDGDGDLDALSASFADNKIAWYENTDGAGSFGSQQVISTAADYPFSVFAADVDGDGDLDALSASAFDDKIAWYENTDGAGSFGTQQVISTAASGARSVFAADLDADGDVDVLSASMFDDKIAWYENTDGAGSFGSQQVVSTAADDPLSVFAADVDGDGDLDVLSASEVDDKIAWYQNTDGAGSFGGQQIISTAADAAWSVFAADVDGDGDLDVLSASGADDKIAWYENTDGAGSFGPQQIISTAAAGATSVFAADVDEDGDLDVLSASGADDKIAWYENTDGAGGFGIQLPISTAAAGATSVFAADADADGDLDVLSASANDAKIAWYENQTIHRSAAFPAQTVISAAAADAWSVFAADVDGDGDLDVLSATARDDKIAWYENTDGAGSFGSQQVISTAADNARSVFAADVDGDGDLDVLSASMFDDKIAWYENTDGAGSFGSQQVIATAANEARSVFVADVDGDGDLDVLSASSGDDKIAWYENSLVREHGRGGELRHPAGDLDGGGRGPLGLRGRRGRGRGSRCPLRVASRRQDRLVREHGRGGELRHAAGDLHGGAGGQLGLRGGRGRGRGYRCSLGLLGQQDRLVREHGRGGELREPAGHHGAGGLLRVGLRGGRGRGRGCGCLLGRRS
jgi:hypothetical protein